MTSQTCWKRCACYSKGTGYATEAVASPAALLDALGRTEFDLVLMDLNYARDTTSGREGLDILTQLKATETAPPIVVMTGWATVGLAVEAMQRGVGDFVEKPWVNVRLLEVLQKQIELGRERRTARRNAIENNQTQTEIASQFQRQGREIEEARAIRLGFLPKEIPQIAGYEIAGAWQPARIVGGDYYDVLAFGEDTLGLCIADVAGKGMPAALLMSNLQAAVRGLASSLLCPEILCERLNSLICRNIANDRFITFFYAHLDGASAICAMRTRDTMLPSLHTAMVRTTVWMKAGACWASSNHSIMWRAHARSCREIECCCSPMVWQKPPVRMAKSLEMRGSFSCSGKIAKPAWNNCRRQFWIRSEHFAAATGTMMQL